MRSANQDTLQGVALTQGRIQVTAGTFEKATTFHCHEDGIVTLTFEDGSTKEVDCVAGDAFPFAAASLTVTSGTFSIGYD